MKYKGVAGTIMGVASVIAMVVGSSDLGLYFVLVGILDLLIRIYRAMPGE